ncbi:Heat-labile enterotoxin, A chain [Beauveria brongniartii RCEF 3172]|uniref:Heat-labile enterotoxin, A chain n=1 Tax=Beauveria brongniartii RCEF 3172 TaxID=1081107 RepID=A0A166WKF1_9HYPO|nr:Heat-labile enterotoxin, A chain [Beauveria brongniartii RCEF 3172]
MINPMNWATAALAFAAVSVQGAALPAITGKTKDTIRTPPRRPERGHADLTGRLDGRAEPLSTVVYRGSTTIPETVKERGGFIPRPRDESKPIINTTFGLQNHHLALASTMYTSTSRDVGVAVLFAQMSFQASAWVYKIHATPNMIDLNDSGFDLKFFDEQEFVALGGVRYDQIEAWAPASESDPNVTANPDFASKKYEGLSTSPGQPQLAGDKANLTKYNEKTLKGYAIKFMEKKGGSAGFDGTFPLNVLKPTRQLSLLTLKRWKLRPRTTQQGHGQR